MLCTKNMHVRQTSCRYLGIIYLPARSPFSFSSIPFNPQRFRKKANNSVPPCTEAGAVLIRASSEGFGVKSEGKKTPTEIGLPRFDIQKVGADGRHPGRQAHSRRNLFVNDSSRAGANFPPRLGEAMGPPSPNAVFSVRCLQPDLGSFGPKMLRVTRV